MIPAGTLIKLEVQGVAVRYGSVIGVPFTAPDNDDIRAAVIAALSAKMDVQQFTIAAAAFADSFVSSLTVKTRIDYAELEHVQLIVRGAFWEASGSIPTVTAIGTRMPGQAVFVDTGQGGQGAVPTGPLDDLTGLVKWGAIAAGAVALVMFARD